jgi:hypothetical protein
MDMPLIWVRRQGIFLKIRIAYTPLPLAITRSAARHKSYTAIAFSAVAAEA